jgi:hypothetical protein
VVVVLGCWLGAADAGRASWARSSLAVVGCR